MKKIGIIFGDNDFGNTFSGVLTTFAKALTEGCEDFFTDKERILSVLNSIVYAHYLMYQYDYEFAKKYPSEMYNQDNPDNEKRIREYLTIGEDKLLLDEEVDKFLADDPFYNGEYVFLDYNNYNNDYEVYIL